MADAAEPRRSFRRHFQNWISWIGLLLAASALFAFLLLFLIDLFAARPSRSVAILAFFVAPFFFFFGCVLSVVGALLTRRRKSRSLKRHEPLAIRIDLSRKRDRRILAIFALSAVAFLFITAVGSY